MMALFSCELLLKIAFPYIIILGMVLDSAFADLTMLAEEMVRLSLFD